MTEKTDWAGLVKASKPRQKSVRLCLRGDLMGELDEAQAALSDTAPVGVATSLAGRADTSVIDAAKDRVDAAAAAVADASVTFRLQGLPRDRYKSLESEHPDPKDEAGWDERTFPEALVRACLVDPVVAADQPLFGIMTAGESDKLFWVAYSACNEAEDVPLPKRG